MTHFARRNSLFILLLCVTGLGSALFSQHIAGMKPCAWCVLQRLILVLIIVVVLGGMLLSKRVPWVAQLTTGVAAALSLGGMMATWYQFTVAANQFSCAQTFADRVMTGLGLDAAMPWLFGIHASCMDARADLIGIDYALWALMLFFALSVLGVITLIRRLADSKLAR